MNGWFIVAIILIVCLFVYRDSCKRQEREEMEAEAQKLRRTKRLTELCSIYEFDWSKNASEEYNVTFLDNKNVKNVICLQYAGLFSKANGHGSVGFSPVKKLDPESELWLDLEAVIEAMNQIVQLGAVKRKV